MVSTKQNATWLLGAMLLREIEIAVISLNSSAYKKFQSITIWTFCSLYFSPREPEHCLVGL